MRDLERWNPFAEFESWLKPYWRLGGSDLAATDPYPWQPSVDIFEKDDHYLLKVELPEVKKEDVQLSVNNGVMAITGERKGQHEDAKRHRIERFYGQFSRSFTLPEGVDPNDIQAEFHEGVLNITLKKVEQPVEQGRRIEIR